MEERSLDCQKRRSQCLPLHTVHTMAVHHEEENGLLLTSTGDNFGRLASIPGAAQPFTCESSTPRFPDSESARQSPMSMIDRDSSKGRCGETGDSFLDTSPGQTPWSLLGRKAQAAQRKSHAELQREMVELFNQSRCDGTVVRTKLGPQGSFKVTADTPPGSFSNKNDKWKCPDETWCAVENPKPRTLPADPKVVDVYKHQLDPAAAAAVILW